MEVASSNYHPGDQQLVDKIVYELKAQGIFDQFRKECIADVDTKPAYQNLRQRVEGSVSGFLSKQTWNSDMNKNQVREMLRKSIHESGFIDVGVERIVDQVVNPKINSVFHPKVEEVVYKYLGIERPTKVEFDVTKEPPKLISHEDLLPQDLEAVSPESLHEEHDQSVSDCGNDDKTMSMETNDSQDINNSKLDEDESPPFEPLEEAGNSNPSNLHEDFSFDSHTSKHSVLARCEDSNHSNDLRISQTDPNTDSQLSRASLSIMTDENSRNSKTDFVESIQPNLSSCDVKKDDSMKMEVDADEMVPRIQSSSDNEVRNFENIGKDADKKTDAQNSDSEKNEKNEERKKDDKIKNEEKKLDRNRSSEKSKTKDDKYKSEKDRHRSEKEKSRHRPDKEKDRHRSDKDRGKSDKDKEKHRSDREKSRNDKDKHRSDKEKPRNSSSDKKELKNTNGKEGESKQENKENKVDKHKQDRDRSTDKSKSDRSKSDKHKSDKNKSDKDKNRSSKSKNDEEKKTAEKIESETADKSEKSKKQESKSEKDRHRKDKDNRKSESEKNPAEKIDKTDKHAKDKSIKGKTDKNKKSEKSEKTSSHVKKDSSHREKEKPKTSLDENSKGLLKSSEKTSSKSEKSKRKSLKDDHYNSKEKKHNRRSTDRDSNDGRSSKKTFGGLSNESQTSNSQKSSQASHSSYNSADSGNSDATEKMQSENENPGTSNQDKIFSPQSASGVKLIKPKFASNFDEARRLMKIRKQISKLEKHNQMMYNTNLQNKSLQLSQSNGEIIVETTGGTSDKHKKDNFETSPKNSIKEINMFEPSYKNKTNRNLQEKELLNKRSTHLHKNSKKPDTNKSENRKGLPHNIGSGVETCVDKSEDISDTTPEKQKHDSVDDSIEEITPPLKDTVITMESWNALEAKLNQEVVMVDYNSYECPDAEYDISPTPNPERKVIPPSKAVELFPSTSASVKENIEPNTSKSSLNSPQSEEDTAVGSKPVSRRASKTLSENLRVSLTETENSTKIIDKDMDQSGSELEIINEIRNNSRTLVVSIEKQDSLERKLSGDSLIEEAENSPPPPPSSPPPPPDLNDDNLNLNVQQSKCSEEQTNELNVKEIEDKTETSSPIIQDSNSEIRETNTEEEMECKYFEVDNISIATLAALKERIQMLEAFILKQTEAIAKAKIASPPSVQLNGPIAKGKKRGRPPSDHNMKNNKLRIVDSPNNNSTMQTYNIKGITMNDGFVVPISLPERYNAGQKEENLKAQKSRNKVSSQRYSSDDLYKPRPHFSTNSRRGRSVTGK